MKTFKNVIPIIILFTCLMFYGGNTLAADDPADKDINNAVDRELLLNATTPAYLIDVTTNDGIVTLSGTVNNILAKHRAVKIAGAVKGVRAVVDMIEVDAPYRSNLKLESDISYALLSDPATDLYEITVKADNGTVTLSGNVDSWQERQLSEYVAKGVIGVKKVINNITVDYVYDRSDYEIKEDIEQSLNNDIRIDNGLIVVSVQNGNVSLSGTVGSVNEKAMAYWKSSWTSGVQSVSMEKLDVKEWARNEDLRKDKYVSKTNNEIQNAVTDALLYDPRVYSFNPEVNVTDGVVTLTGKVDNLKAKRAAEQDAKNVVGVLRIKNYIKVRPAFIPDDEDLETDIELAILKNPIVEKWEVDVIANNGVVYLNGIVDSYFEKSTAEDIASRINGVVAIENNLSVFDDNDYFLNDYSDWNTYYPPYHVDIAYRNTPDYIIKQNIIDELWWSPYVNEDEVNVIVTDGKAILSGTVDTRREKLFAEINALEGGANEVENNLIVDFNPE